MAQRTIYAKSMKRELERRLRNAAKLRGRTRHSGDDKSHAWMSWWSRQLKIQ